VGLVLGAGGATGRGFHVGLLAALEDVTGFDATTAAVLVGTSSGAPIAGLVRAGVSGTDLAGRACGQPDSRRMIDLTARRIPRPTPTGPRRVIPPWNVGPPTAWRALWAGAQRPSTQRFGTMASALLPLGRVPSVASAGLTAGLFPGGWPPAGLQICAVDVDRAQRVVFSRESSPATDVDTAIAASCALPGWFAPVTVAGSRYVDGAAWSSTNADVLADEPLDVVIVSSPMTSSKPGWGRVTDPIAGVHHRYLDAEIAGLRQRGISVLVIEPDTVDRGVMGSNMMDGRRRNAVIRHVRAALRARFASGALGSQINALNLA
jgi:NTE family protein